MTDRKRKRETLTQIRQIERERETLTQIDR